jgi:FAD/FMN-containing dehydrogenase
MRRNNVTYQDKLERLRQDLRSGASFNAMKKGTTSNLFRYGDRQQSRGRRLDLSGFTDVISIDPNRKVMEAEGLVTYEQIVDASLSHNLLPTIAPELKHITVGGATVGIGIESSGFRHGFVHDGLLEADVLLSSGEVVTCGPDENADLFKALPNSYGTLGYILRARLKLVEAGPFVRLTTEHFDSLAKYVDAFSQYANSKDIDFLEGLFTSKDQLYLTTGKLVDSVAETTDIFRGTPYYKLALREGTVELKTKDYIFRFDPDWFWNVPETGFYSFFRRYAPLSMRSSKFYNWYVARKHALRRALNLPANTGEEKLIQDWEVPWQHAVELLRYALDEADLGGQPWVAVPIKPLSTPTLYPVDPNELYMNLGCYCYTRKPREDVPYYYTKILDEKCFELGGIKMLYSSTFIDKARFDGIYNGAEYEEVKRKYDPDGKFLGLFDKTVM